MSSDGGTRSRGLSPSPRSLFPCPSLTLPKGGTGRVLNHVFLTSTHLSAGQPPPKGLLTDGAAGHWLVSLHW